MYAGFWRRFAAAILDLLILIVPMLVIGIVVALITGPKSRATLAADLGTLFIPWLYFAVMESSRRGATLGKIAFGMRVVDLRGDRISFFRASGRFFAKAFSIASLTLGFLMVAVTLRKQALHDIVASCLVVNREVAPADLAQAGLAQPMSFRAITLLVIGVISVPFVGIGAAIAIPHYKDYRLRAKLDEAVRSGQGSAAGVAAYMVRHKSPPRSLEDASAALSSPHVREAAITRDGTIVLTLALDRVEGKRISFVPSKQAQGRIAWTCTSDVPARYLPRQCSGSGAARER